MGDSEYYTSLVQTIAAKYLTDAVPTGSVETQDFAAGTAGAIDGGTA